MLLFKISNTNNAPTIFLNKNTYSVYVLLIFSVSCMCMLQNVDIFDNGEFFQSRVPCKSARAIFLLILCSHKCGILYTRFHASVFSSSMVFVWWKITGESIFL